MTDYVIEITVRTNVQATHPGFSGWDAVAVAMSYGLEELVATGEYSMVAATIVGQVADENEDDETEDDGEEV